MTFRSTIRPRCRACGKLIRKRTETLWFGHTGTGNNEHLGYFKDKPMTKDEVQRFSNLKLVNVSYHIDHDTGERLYIWKASFWDGESYDDEFFDKQSCAMRLGYAAAKAGHSLGAYKP